MVRVLLLVWGLFRFLWVIVVRLFNWCLLVKLLGVVR